ncbi:sigma-70 family RNA polymerase sigma factor [Clostridium amylolyticum]|nr:sigma-70 family RNA polymerase sigma factor [Clostridium amylolyticum]
MEQTFLVRSAVKGNKEAFTALIHQYKNELYNVAYIYTKNQDDALDAIDESVYKAYISIKKLKKPEFFKTWLIRILINECISLLRKKNKIVLEADNSKLDSSYDDINLNIDHEELYKALNILTDKQRTAIVLKYFDDLKISTIAEIMEVPENTAKAHIRRGLLALRKSLKEDVISG